MNNQQKTRKKSTSSSNWKTISRADLSKLLPYFPEEERKFTECLMAQLINIPEKSYNTNENWTP
ncbi:MAG: hypothetical protein K2P23_11535 [Lachnospiraceae bacterium]|nr:hypothetical protein [Lachnospiraceae bacterium]